jgi:hypothetical protein
MCDHLLMPASPSGRAQIAHHRQANTTQIPYSGSPNITSMARGAHESHMPTKCRISYSCAASTSHNNRALPYITTRSTDHPSHTNAPGQLNAGAQPGALQQRACSLYAWPIIPSPKQADYILSRDTQHRTGPNTAA